MLGAEIKGLDGERKALVYDNYSKLISATDTIRKVRGRNFRPLSPPPSPSPLRWILRHKQNHTLTKKPPQAQMRSNMDPLTPATSTLSPAISHIAETATSLAELPRHRSLRSEKPTDGGADAAKRRQQETVKWVLGTPRRLQVLLNSGKGEEAAENWVETRRLLDKWEGVKGVDRVRDECLKVMGIGNGGDGKEVGS